MIKYKLMAFTWLSISEEKDELTTQADYARTAMMRPGN
jgi:hypothetical protein